MATATGLTQNDTVVLNMLFNPESATSGVQQSQPSETSRGARYEDLERLESSVIESINSNDVSSSKILKAIAAFDEILKADPEFASAYNDRAQARRMLHNIKDLHQHPGDVELIMQDLNSAIHYASSTENHAVSSAAEARVSAAAYTHRGYMFFRCARDAELRSVVGSIDGYCSEHASFWEEIASRDFAMGGKFGNPLAKRMAVHTNPYAKLCGEMVKQAIHAELSGSAIPT